MTQAPFQHRTVWLRRTRRTRRSAIRGRPRARRHPGVPLRCVLLCLAAGGLAVAVATRSAAAASVPGVVACCAAVAAGASAFRHRAVTGLPGGGRRAALRTAGARIAAVLAVLLVLPVLAAVAVAVELTSRGPVLLRRARAGSGPVLAFRCTDRRGRTTRLGRLLQRSSLDGLPALFDVASGRVALPGRWHPGPG